MANSGTVARVSKLPECDFCKRLPHDEHSANPPREAKYDFKTSAGPWGNGCEQHYLDFRRFTSLGVGRGQLLVVRGEKES